MLCASFSAKLLDYGAAMRSCAAALASIDKVNAGDDAAMLPVVVGVVGVVSSAAAVVAVVDDNFATAYFSTGNSTQRTACSQFLPPLAPCLPVFPRSTCSNMLCVFCAMRRTNTTHTRDSERDREMRRWRQWKSRELDGMGDFNKFIQTNI